MLVNLHYRRTLAKMKVKKIVLKQNTDVIKTLSSLRNIKEKKYFQLSNTFEKG